MMRVFKGHEGVAAFPSNTTVSSKGKVDQSVSHNCRAVVKTSSGPALPGTRVKPVIW
jgi:hypothetical protein